MGFRFRKRIRIIPGLWLNLFQKRRLAFCWWPGRHREYLQEPHLARGMY